MSSLKIQIIEKHDSITLKTSKFSVRMNRYSASCSGEISKESFNKIIGYVRNLKKDESYGQKFQELKNEEFLKSFLSPLKSYKIGDSVTFNIGKKTISGIIVDENAKNFIVKDEIGNIKVQKAILL